jgi:hypothetical protein
MFYSGLVLPSLFAMWTDTLPPEHRTTGLGIGTMISLIFGAMPGPLYLCTVSDTLERGASGLRNGSLTFMLVAFLAAIIYFAICRFYPTDRASVSDEVSAEK